MNDATFIEILFYKPKENKVHFGFLLMSCVLSHLLDEGRPRLAWSLDRSVHCSASAKTPAGAEIGARESGGVVTADSGDTVVDLGVEGGSAGSPRPLTPGDASLPALALTQLGPLVRPLGGRGVDVAVF